MKLRTKALLALWLFVGAVSIPFVGWYVSENMGVAHWSGGYQLRVHVASAKTIREIRCYPAFRQSMAELAAHDQGSWNEFPDRIKPYVGSSIEARVRTGGRSGWFGMIDEWSQDHWLAVVAEFDDGTRVGKVVEIPDMQTGREVRIEFP